MTLIEVDGVAKSFASRHGSISIMQDITFSVADNDFLAIVGPSGCGKSTLLRLMIGLDHPSSGQIRFSTTSRRAPQPASIIASSASAIPPRPIWAIAR